MNVEVGQKYRASSREASSDALTVLAVVDTTAGTLVVYEDRLIQQVVLKLGTFLEWYRPVPKRYVVEYRHPEEGEQFFRAVGRPAVDSYIVIANIASESGKRPVIVEEL